MAATQTSQLDPETATPDCPEKDHPGNTATNFSTSPPHAPNSDGSGPAHVGRDMGIPAPTTPSVASPVDSGQRGHALQQKEPIRSPQEEPDINCDGDNVESGRVSWASVAERSHDTGLNEQRKDARLRLMKSKEYTQILEDRLTELERTVQRIRKLPELPVQGDSEATDKKDKIPATRSRIDYLRWAQFREVWKGDKKPGINWTHRPELDAIEMKGVIEILQEEPRFSWGFKADSGPMGSLDQIPRIPDLHGVIGPQMQSEVEPHRIRIRSMVLLKLLNKITGCNTTVGPFRHRLVLLRPFKLLVAFEKDLNEYLDGLDQIHSPIADTDDSYLKKIGNDDQETKEAREHLKLLCKVINVNLQSQVKLYRQLTPDVQKVHFHDLWHIFRPGFEVRTRNKSQVQLYRVLQVTGGRDNLSSQGAPDVPASEKLRDQAYSPGVFVIECFYIHFDGSRYGPVNATFQIRKFEGKKSVTSFPIYPIDCDPDNEETRKSLLARGNRFASLSGIKNKTPAHRKYKGLTLDKTQEQVDSEIIVDFQLAYRRMKDDRPNLGIDGLVGDDMREVNEDWKSCKACDRSGCCGNDIIYADYEVDDKERSEYRERHKRLFEFIDDEEHLIPEHKVLLPPKVHGFVLRTRKWATFDIDMISPPDYVSSGWPDLVIDEGTKKTVLALVANHERSEPKSNTPARHDNHVLSSVDLVQGKGRGLIILLHGEPGVGKTSTAECVAAYSHRPLFPITCGDIGDRPQDIEANLEQNFQLAHKWGCVLLLDEADIFLSTRNDEDLRRNAIVSVFLRTLEYYSGILFITTNRVGRIDRAFKSRIHLSLYYPKLDESRTIKIWENNLKRVQNEFSKDKKKIEVDEDNIIAYAKEHFRKLNGSPGLSVWNGRQIRNAFQTAIAIATYEAKEASQNGQGEDSHKAGILTLRVKHFKKVAKNTKEFDMYLNSVNLGKSESQLAKQNTWRYDDFKNIYTDDESEEREDRKKRKESRRNRRYSSSDSTGSGDTSPAPKKKRRKY